ncbi:MAG: hypothetical protein ACKV22_06290 [Bryobacteraceae bacterium]
MGLVLDSSVLVAAERQQMPVSTLLDRLQKQHGVTEIVRILRLIVRRGAPNPAVITLQFRCLAPKKALSRLTKKLA